MPIALTQFPLSGTITVTQGYGGDRSHNQTITTNPWAVDFSAGEDAPVYSVFSGTVVGIRTDSYNGDTGAGRYGNFVTIQDDNTGYYATYAHLKTDNVSINQHVNAGDPIGTVGNTGDADGYHLHLHFGTVTSGTTQEGSGDVIRAFGGGDAVPPYFFADFFGPNEVGTVVNVNDSTTILDSDLFGTGYWGGDVINESDELHGDSRDNRIFGGNGPDRLYGEDGDDILVGGTDKDSYDGGTGYDTVNFEYSSSNWTVSLADGTATAVGGAEDGITEALVSIESVIGGKGNDTLISAADRGYYLVGDAGNDTLRGNVGDDVLEGGWGDDTIEGGGNGSRGDEAIFYGSRSAYTASQNADGSIRVAGGPNATDGTDTLYDVELFTFTNGTQTKDDDQTYTQSELLDTNPPVEPQSTLPVSVGGTSTISHNFLWSHDDVSGPAGVTYNVVTAPAHGTLLLNGSATASFTQADIDNGRLEYRHNGDTATGDGFTFTVSDEAGNTIGPEPFTIAVVDTAEPVLAANAGVTAPISGNALIWRDSLSAVALGNDPADMHYQLIAPPAHGALVLTGDTPTPAISFTQADIDNGRLVYVSNGEIATRDRFTFTVVDKGGEQTAVQTFDVSLSGLTPVTPPPGWHAIGAGDFAGDGIADILWQHDNGEIAFWLIDGTSTTFQDIGPPPPQWHATGTTDLNGDGRADILWQHENGLSGAWLMDGTRPLNTFFFPAATT